MMIGNANNIDDDNDDRPSDPDDIIVAEFDQDGDGHDHHNLNAYIVHVRMDRR